MAAMETAVDLVLLDDRIQVGVLRGGLLQHPKYPGKRIFNAGINLTHLYYGQISFIEFIIERELGLLNKIYRGHSQSGPPAAISSRTLSRNRGSRWLIPSPSAAAASCSASWTV